MAAALIPHLSEVLGRLEVPATDNLLKQSENEKARAYLGGEKGTRRGERGEEEGRTLGRGRKQTAAMDGLEDPGEA